MAHNPVLALLRTSFQFRQITLEIVSEVLGIELEKNEGVVTRFAVRPSTRIHFMRRFFASHRFDEAKLVTHRSASSLLDCYYHLGSCSHILSFLTRLACEVDFGDRIFEVMKSNVHHLCVSFHRLSPEISTGIRPVVLAMYMRGFREIIYGYPMFLFTHVLIVATGLDSHYAGSPMDGHYTCNMKHLADVVAPERVFNQDHYNNLKSQFVHYEFSKDSIRETVMKIMHALGILEQVINYDTRPGSNSVKCQQSAKDLHVTFTAHLRDMPVHLSDGGSYDSSALPLLRTRSSGRLDSSAASS